MVITLRTPNLRSLTLVLAGVVVGAVLVAPVVARDGSPAAVEPTAIQTRSISCQGLNFHAIDDRTLYAYNGGMRVRWEAGGSGYFQCDPDLPNRATVTKVQFTVRDFHQDVEVRYCALYRSGLTVATAPAPVDIMAEVPTTGMDAMPGDVRLTDTSILNPTINNTRYGYALQCQINFRGLSEGGPSGIYGANVVYTIDSANG